jgi:hypothetical protein
MNEVVQELREIESEGGIDADLAEQRDEIAEWCHDLESGRRIAPAFLRRLHDKESVWQLERNKLRESIAAKEMQLGGVVGRMDILERANDDAARVHLLKQLIEAARTRPPEDVLVQRVKSVFVRLMLSNVSIRAERARSYRAAAESVRRELHAAETQLANEYQIHVGKKETEHTPARARGRFDAEVALYAEHLPECEDGPIPPDMVVLEDFGKVERTFVLEDHRIVEVTPPSEERAP